MDQNTNIGHTDEVAKMCRSQIIAPESSYFRQHFRKKFEVQPVFCIATTQVAIHDACPGRFEFVRTTSLDRSLIEGRPRADSWLHTKGNYSKGNVARPLV